MLLIVLALITRIMFQMMRIITETLMNGFTDTMAVLVNYL